MEEKVIIRGTQDKIKTIPIVVIVVGIILFMITGATGWSYDDIVPFMYILSVSIIIVGVIFYLSVLASEICVTDKRIYGRALFGARVDLPLDVISAVGSETILKGISVSTSSGRIRFFYISNADTIHAVISKLLIQRQEKSTVTYVEKEHISGADELSKYKKLLDEGAITQEEYDKKKKQVLDL